MLTFANYEKQGTAKADGNKIQIRFLPDDGPRWKVREHQSDYILS